MRKICLIATAVITIGILGWFIDVFGRTMNPLHRGPRHVQVTPVYRPVSYTWDGHVRTNSLARD